MSGENKDVKLQLKVMVNKERNKVLYAVTDNHFADILLSFLTLPLGRIVKLLEKQLGDTAPKIGRLSSLYHGLADLDTSHFVTGGAKNTLLNPISLFEAEYRRLKLDIADNRSDDHSKCVLAGKKGCEDVYSSDGVFITQKASFTISDDLQIFPNETGLLRIITALGITDAHDAEEIQVEFGHNEFMKLLKASLTSQTPLSDIILPKKTRPVKNPAMMEPQLKMEVKKSAYVKDTSLIAMVQISTGKLLYAQAKEDFVDFLFSLLHFPLGGVECLLSGRTPIMAINNLYRTTTDLKREHFNSLCMKKRLMEPELPHGCISQKPIIPIPQEPYHADCKIWRISYRMFPKGYGSYLLGPKTYMVTDDLTVTPFCAVSALAALNDLKIPVSDVKEVELQIGLEEGLSILKASLASTSALTNVLLKHIPNKRVKKAA